ncbi:MAG: hypothetical protein IT209_08950, partial [Armatimonadetes bacterium]|nr:hypothetical protein [Armatimonadota bacterium]
APAAPGAKPAPQPGSAITLSPKAGEIVVEGTIKKLSPSDGGFVMQVTGITLPGQGPITLSPPREKTVVPNSPAAITQGGQPAKLGALKTGARVSAVGPNKGKGTTLRARQIQL